MKHHVAMLTAGALALAAGLSLMLQTTNEAGARTIQRQQTFRPQINRQVTRQVQQPRINRQVQQPRINRQVLQPRINRQVLKPRVNRQVNQTQINRSQISPRSRVPSGPNKINIIGGQSNKLNRPIGITSGPNRVGPATIMSGPRTPPNRAAAIGALRGPNVGRINNQNITIFRGRRDIFWNGRLRTLVALAVLGGIYVGSTYYIADGYVPLAAPVCRGITAEGCSLVWRDVATEDGDVIAQCVQFCPQRPVATAVDAPPVAQPTSAPVPAPLAQGCAISIHAEPNFGGVNSDVTSDQPQLGQYGWDKAISSINVKSGTWDFYSDENYGGQMIRLGPGQYATLAQGWDKQINSMMCAQP